MKGELKGSDFGAKQIRDTKPVIIFQLTAGGLESKQSVNPFVSNSSFPRPNPNT